MTDDGKAEKTGSDSTPNPGAVKHDQGKIRAGLMMRGFPRALKAVAEVTTFGASKYAPDGWQYVPNAIERYNDALDRHLLDRHITLRDPESNLLHLAHAAWNALAALELELRAIEQAKEIEQVMFTPGRPKLSDAAMRWQP